MKILWIRKRTMLLAAGILIAVAIFCSVNAPTVVETSAATRQLPIYCVDRADNMIAISFDAAWGDVRVRQCYNGIAMEKAQLPTRSCAQILSICAGYFLSSRCLRVIQYLQQKGTGGVFLQFFGAVLTGKVFCISMELIEPFLSGEQSMEAMQWACGAGVINGITDGNSMKLDPIGNATRAQVAAMLQRFCVEVMEP